MNRPPSSARLARASKLSANAMHVLNHLGLGDAITAVSVKPGAYVFRTYDTGEKIHRFSVGRA